MRVLVKHWSENNDGAGMEAAFHKAFASSEFVRNSLTQSAFVVNQENLPGALLQI